MACFVTSSWSILITSSLSPLPPSTILSQTLWLPHRLGAKVRILPMYTHTRRLPVNDSFRKQLTALSLVHLSFQVYSLHSSHFHTNPPTTSIYRRPIFILFIGQFVPINKRNSWPLLWHSLLYTTPSFCITMSSGSDERQGGGSGSSKYTPNVLPVLSYPRGY